MSFSRLSSLKQGRKRPLDTLKKMIERREREGERKKGTKRDIEREGEIKERERVREVKGAQSKPNPSPNAFPKLWDATVPSLRGKSSGIMSGNYPWIISGNYYLVYP